MPRVYHMAYHMTYGMPPRYPRVGTTHPTRSPGGRACKSMVCRRDHVLLHELGSSFREGAAVRMGAVV
eukprot:3621313-Rhodomonas_salina.1